MISFERKVTFAELSAFLNEMVRIITLVITRLEICSIYNYVITMIIESE